MVSHIEYSPFATSSCQMRVQITWAHKTQTKEQLEQNSWDNEIRNIYAAIYEYNSGLLQEYRGTERKS